MSFEDLSQYWKANILVESLPLFDKDTGGQIGRYLDPKEFIPLHMTRWLQRMEMEGKLPPPGNYHMKGKVWVAKAFL